MKESVLDMLLDNGLTNYCGTWKQIKCFNSKLNLPKKKIEVLDHTIFFLLKFKSPDFADFQKIVDEYHAWFTGKRPASSLGPDLVSQNMHIV